MIQALPATEDVSCRGLGLTPYSLRLTPFNQEIKMNMKWNSSASNGHRTAPLSSETATSSAKVRTTAGEHLEVQRQHQQWLNQARKAKVKNRRRIQTRTPALSGGIHPQAGSRDRTVPHRVALSETVLQIPGRRILPFA